MTKTSPKPGQKFKFLPDYADTIANAASNWATLEYYINASIWTLADTKPALGACLTSQIMSLHGRLNALLALMKIRKVDKKLITKVNKFAESVRTAQDMRNRIIHDMWLNDEDVPSNMGRFRITADKLLKFTVDTVPIEDLKEELEIIIQQREAFAKIWAAIGTAHDTLPKIPHQELHPIVVGPYHPT